MTNVLYDAPGPRARRLSLLFSIVAGAIIVAALVALFVFLSQPRANAAGVPQPGLFDPSRWDLLNDRAFWRAIGRGLAATLQMAGIAAVGAVVAGVVLSMLRTARSAIVRWPAIALIEFFRGMPVLLLMLFVLLIFSSGQLVAGITALILYNGAVIGEALRAGIVSLPRGQAESGLALGLTPLQVRFEIEFPQAFRQMLPIILAQLVVLLKDTSLAFILGYQELLNIGLRQTPVTFGAQYLFTAFFVVWAIYLGVNLVLSNIARLVARRTAAGRPRGRGRRARRVMAQLGGAGVNGASDALTQPGASADDTTGRGQGR